MIRSETASRSVFTVLDYSTRPENYVASAGSGGDDSAAVAAAFADGRPVCFDGRKTYRVKDLLITGSCPGIYSVNGRATISPTADATSSTIMMTVLKDDFVVENVLFDLPTSTDSGTAPTCDRALKFVGSPSTSTVSRFWVVNCRFRGGKFGPYFSLASNVFVESCLITDVWGTSITVDQYNCCTIVNNQITDGGFNAASASGAIRVGTSTQLALAEELIIDGNIIARYNEDTGQEAIDLTGLLARNVSVCDNVITDTGNGGIEAKTVSSVLSPNVYKGWLVAGNLIRLTNGAASVGVNFHQTTPSPQAAKSGFLKIEGNLIFSDSMPSSGNSVYGVVVNGYDDFDVSDNTIINVNQGINVDAATVSGTTMSRGRVFGNNVYAINNALSDGSGTIDEVEISGNRFWATTGVAVQLDTATWTNLRINNNPMIRSDASYAIELQDVSDSEVIDNRIIAGLDGVLTQTDTPDNVLFSDNKIKCTGTGHAFRLGTGTNLKVLQNKVEVADSARIVVGAGSYVAAGNTRGSASADPSASVAGSLGDIVLNSSPSSGGAEKWICTTAGNAGAAVYKAVAIA